MTNYFDNYIMQPVLRKAVPSSGGDDTAADDAAADNADAPAASKGNPRRYAIFICKFQDSPLLP